MSAGSGDVLPAFQAWMEGVGIEYSDAVRLVGGPAGSLGVKAARDIAEGERLCTIPKAACLSIRTSQLADVIEAEELGGGLGLVLAVLHEMSLGEGSKWHGYFQSLPAREFLPLFWSGAQLGLLQGTELDGKVEADREAAAEDFQDHVLPLLDKYPGRLNKDFVTLHNFHVAASLVASRAFGVDEWHGDAMVPLADVFNHKASVVELGEGYEVHGAGSSDDDDDDDYDDDEEGSGAEGEEEEGEEGSDVAGSGSGSEDAEQGAEQEEEEEGHRNKRRKRHRVAHDRNAGCTHDHHSHGDAHGQQAGSDESDGEGEGAEDAGEALPAVMRSGGEASIYGLKSANGLHLRLEMGIVDRDEDTLEIVAASAVPAGAEVHNTYGELGNAELVKKYGFALRQNPFTVVTLDKARLLSAARAALGQRAWRARSKLLGDQTEVLEEDEEPFEALPNGHISASLYVALRVLGATNAELAGWRTIGDALRVPAAAAGSDASGKQAAAAAAAASNGDKDDDDEEEEEEEPRLGAVQVWPVLDAEGSPLSDRDCTAAGAAPETTTGAAAAGEQQLGGQGEEQQQEGHAALLPAGMWRLVRDAVQQRQAAYAAPLEADLEKLRAQQEEGAGAGAGAEAGIGAGPNATAGVTGATLASAAGAGVEVPPAEEQLAAERAALLLRITEKEVLRDMLSAIDKRLAALEACGEQAEEETSTAQQKKRNRQAAGEGQGKKNKREAGKDKAAATGSNGARGRRQR